MPTFITYGNWTDQGARNIKEGPARARASQELLKKLGGEMKAAYVVTGGHDVVMISEAPDGQVMAKFALALASQGNLRRMNSGR
jgi:uncharacterized protein with GYD domain